MNGEASLKTVPVEANATQGSLDPSGAADAITGGCLCGQLRYEAKGRCSCAGSCSCLDCRRSSGAGSVGFMAFPSDAFRFVGETLPWHTISLRGHNTVRHHCPTCGSLVFGEIAGESKDYVVFAGSLDDPSHFKPTLATFNRTRPVWAPLPQGVQVFETMPGCPTQVPGVHFSPARSVQFTAATHNDI